MLFKRLLIVAAASAVVAGAYAGLHVTRFVAVNQAYAHYMPPSHGIRAFQCNVRIWDVTLSIQVVGDLRQCADVATYLMMTAATRDPSVPIQWDPTHVRLLQRAPR